MRRVTKDKAVSSPATLNEDGSITLRQFKFEADIVQGWRDAVRIELDDEALDDLKKRAEAVQAQQDGSKKRRVLSKQGVIDIINLFLQTDATQQLIARVVGSSQTNVSNYILWITSIL